MPQSSLGPAAVPERYPDLRSRQKTEVIRRCGAGKSPKRITCLHVAALLRVRDALALPLPQTGSCCDENLSFSAIFGSSAAKLGSGADRHAFAGPVPYKTPPNALRSGKKTRIPINEGRNRITLV